MKKQFTILTLVMLSFSAYAQHDHSHASRSQEKSTPAFKDEKVGVAYNHYIHLKDALVASNEVEAKKAADDLKESFVALKNAQKAAGLAEQIAVASNLTAQRKSFAVLSKEMTTIIKTSEISSGALYVEYCPMANDHEGATWLSNEKEIKNPYFGDKMLKCGSVKETLE
jgi:hypothetical protein